MNLTTRMQLTILLGWLCFELLTLGLGGPLAFSLEARLAVPIGLGFGLFCAIFLRNTIPVRGLIAVIGPIGVLLPLLALREMAIELGVPIERFTTVDLLAFLALYLVLLCSAAGIFRVDIYRFGYAPVPVAVIVLAICALSFVQGMPFLALVAVTGQLMWVMRLESSNYFDHITHALMVPAIVLVLILRMF